jgi:hypothetical protein
MRPWLSTMPVLGECNAATHSSCGSSARASACQQHQVIDAVGGRLLAYALQLRDCAWLVHDQLAAAPVAYAAFGAVGIQQCLAFHAQPGLERALRVIDAGVDHLAVARTGARAYGVGGFKHHHLPALQGQRARHGQTHHARAHHHTIDLVHQRPSKPSMTLTALVPSSAAA